MKYFNVYITNKKDLKKLSSILDRSYAVLLDQYKAYKREKQVIVFEIGLRNDVCSYIDWRDKGWFEAIGRTVLSFSEFKEVIKPIPFKEKLKTVKFW